MSKVLVVKDKKNRIIHLTDERWKHITTKHTNITQILDINDTLTNPLIIKQDKFDKDVCYYYKFNKLKSMYLMVAVKFLKNNGFVITSFYTKNIKK